MSGGGGGGCCWNQLSTFDAEFKFAKNQNSYGRWGGGGGWWNQLATFDAEFKVAKNQNFHVWWGGGGETNFQLLMLSPNLLKKSFCEQFSKFSGKNVNGFVLDFEYQVVRHKGEPQ